jgi:hypothetical protein
MFGLQLSITGIITRLEFALPLVQGASLAIKRFHANKETVFGAP